MMQEVVVCQQPGQTAVEWEGQEVSLPDATTYYRVTLERRGGRWGYKDRSGCDQSEFELWQSSVRDLTRWMSDPTGYQGPTQPV